MAQATTDISSETTPTEVWSEADLRENPHGRSDKSDKVRRMFGAIAHRYDLNNRVHSFGRDQAWRRCAVRMSGVTSSEEVLDVACGTGDLTRAFAHAGARTVTGLDFTPEMLDIARRKRSKSASARTAEVKISYVEGDAMALPFEDASFDVVSIAFGIRNVSDPGVALAEFRRVLRPGGRLIILEFSRPKLAPVRWGNDLYCRVIMPRTATLISRDRSGAYKYLPRSIETFLSREAMSEAMNRAGLGSITSRGLTLGVCTCYRGVVG